MASDNSNGKKAAVDPPVEDEDDLPGPEKLRKAYSPTEATMAKMVEELRLLKKRVRTLEQALKAKTPEKAT